jgi:MFS family permease
VLLRLPGGVVALALVGRLVDEWWSYLPAGAIGDLRSDLGVTYAQAGWLLALLWVGGLAGAPLGALADHVARRPLAAGGAGLLATGLVPYALGAPFAVLAASSFVLGAASDMTLRSLEASLEEVAGDRLDKLIGRQHLITWAGDLIGPLLLAATSANAGGWRAAFAVTAAVLGVYGVTLAITEFPPPPRPADHVRGAWRDGLALLRRRDVQRLAAVEFLLAPLDEALLGFAVARLIGAGHGHTSQLLAVGVFVGGLAGSGLVSAAGLSDRIRRVGPVVLLAGTLLVAPDRGAVVGTAAMSLVGFGMALTWASVHQQMLVVERGRSATVSAVVGIIATPAALVPVAIGLVADRTTITVGLWGYTLVALALVAVAPSRAGERLPGPRPSLSSDV